MKRALVDGTVPEIADGDFSGVVIFLGKSDSGRQRGLAPNDAVAAVEMLFLAEKVHRTALAAGTAGDFSK